MTAFDMAHPPFSMKLPPRWPMTAHGGLTSIDLHVVFGKLIDPIHEVRLNCQVEWMRDTGLRHAVK
jgi:hypothetical protein